MPHVHLHADCDQGNFDWSFKQGGWNLGLSQHLFGNADLLANRAGANSKMQYATWFNWCLFPAVNMHVYSPIFHFHPFNSEDDAISIYLFLYVYYILISHERPMESQSLKTYKSRSYFFLQINYIPHILLYVLWCQPSKLPHSLAPRCHASQVGEELKQHFREIPASQHVVLPDQGLVFEDMDGPDSDDSGLDFV